MTTAVLALVLVAAAACSSASGATGAAAALTAAPAPQPTAHGIAQPTTPIRPQAPNAEYTRGFRFYNRTGYHVTFQKADGDAKMYGPADGSVLPADASVQDFELVWNFLAETSRTLWFGVTDSSGKQVAQVVVLIGIGPSVSGNSMYVRNGGPTTAGWMPHVNLQTSLNGPPTTIDIAHETPPRDHWMASLGPQLQNRRLTDVVIPGSHDSGTYSFGSGQALGLATTQSEDTVHQLNDGIREFDFRVERRPDGKYYVHHGSGFTDFVSPWLTLDRIFQDVSGWATAPGHEHEVVMLNLSISGTSATEFPTATCRGFGQTLGEALVTPDVLQAHFQTGDPGSVALGKLWSLPDTKNTARVIMDDDQCMNAAHPAAGSWPSNISAGLFGGYYADQCRADGEPGKGPRSAGIRAPVLRAVDFPRGYGPPGGDPTPVIGTKMGGLYVLDIQGTPEPQNNCLIDPQGMVRDEIVVLTALVNQWYVGGRYPGGHNTKNSMNIVAGDFIQETELVEDTLFIDASQPM